MYVHVTTCYGYWFIQFDAHIVLYQEKMMFITTYRCSNVKLFLFSTTKVKCAFIIEGEFYFLPFLRLSSHATPILAALRRHTSAVIRGA